jgi:hypothetical protein
VDLPLVPYLCPQCRQVVWLSSEGYEEHLVAGRCRACRESERQRREEAARWGAVGLRDIRRIRGGRAW